ncbi:sulfurtransferase TusA family protein, partial [Bacillus paranthracis]
AMEALQSGEVLEVHVTDKGAIKDIPAWSQTGGHEVLRHTEEKGELKFWIKKA